MGFLSRQQVSRTVEDAIAGRKVLTVRYQHKEDGEVVAHRIAPFDIGSTNPNPKIRERSRNNLYAYSFTHLDDKTNRPDPKVCAFNIERFIQMEATGDSFDEADLAIKNLRATGYDYRNCRFAILPNRNWFIR